MNSLVIAGLVFLSTISGAALGIFLRGRLPAEHLTKESQDVVKLATGLIGSMAALVLGLLVASATGDFNSQRTSFEQLASNVILLDRALSGYGPEAGPARESLRRAVSLAIDQLWPTDGSRGTVLSSVEVSTQSKALFDALRQLTPETEAQRAIQSQALAIATELGRTRMQLIVREETSIPRAFIFVLVFWLSILFTSFGLFAPRNATVIVVLVVCSLSVSGAVFLIVDMDQPFEGLIQISSAPMRTALAQLGK